MHRELDAQIGTVATDVLLCNASSSSIGGRIVLEVDGASTELSVPVSASLTNLQAILSGSAELAEVGGVVVSSVDSNSGSVCSWPDQGRTLIRFNMPGA